MKYKNYFSFHHATKEQGKHILWFNRNIHVHDALPRADARHPSNIPCKKPVIHYQRVCPLKNAVDMVLVILKK